jgi:hypothetical protein
MGSLVPPLALSRPIMPPTPEHLQCRRKYDLHELHEMEIATFPLDLGGGTSVQLPTSAYVIYRP